MTLRTVAVAAMTIRKTASSLKKMRFFKIPLLCHGNAVGPSRSSLALGTLRVFGAILLGLSTQPLSRCQLEKTGRARVYSCPQTAEIYCALAPEVVFSHSRKFLFVVLFSVFQRMATALSSFHVGMDAVTSAPQNGIPPRARSSSSVGSPDRAQSSPGCVERKRPPSAASHKRCHAIRNQADDPG